MVRTVRKSGMKVPFSEVKNELSRYLKETVKEQILDTRHGKPGALIGFETEDEWFDFRFENVLVSSIASRAPAPACVPVRGWDQA